MSKRRSFLAQLSAAATSAMLLDPAELRAGTRAAREGSWDTSWLDRLASATYRVVFNGSDIADGIVFNYVSSFLHGFGDAHGSPDAELRPVIVFRRLGTVMALNDTLWDKYAIGAERNVKDNGAPARRNLFWSSPTDHDTTIEALQKRGLICLVCDVSAHSLSFRFAEKSGVSQAEAYEEVRTNLVPGAILVPSGIYALIRAQNAGCAYMAGT